MLNLIDHLPQHSFYYEALLNDSEMAELYAGESQGEYAERVSRFSPEVAMLASAVDRLGSLINAVVVMNGGKALDIPPLPRPVTLFDRIRAERARRRSDRFMRRMESQD